MDFALHLNRFPAHYGVVYSDQVAELRMHQEMLKCAADPERFPYPAIVIRNLGVRPIDLGADGQEFQRFHELICTSPNNPIKGKPFIKAEKLFPIFSMIIDMVIVGGASSLNEFELSPDFLQKELISNEKSENHMN